MTEECDYGSVSYASRSIRMRPLDAFDDDLAMSVYCKCGRIVIQDRSEMRLRLSLGKELECMSCRNIRISEEIDALNDHYNGVEEVEDWLV